MISGPRKAKGSNPLRDLVNSTRSVPAQIQASTAHLLRKNGSGSEAATCTMDKSTFSREVCTAVVFVFVCI